MSRTHPAVEFRSHVQLPGAFAPGAALLNGVAITASIPVYPSVRCRTRVKANVAGTLELVFLRAPNSGSDDEVATGNPGSVPVAADTEAILETDLYGESHVLLRFTPSGAGAITWADFSQI